MNRYDWKEQYVLAKITAGEQNSGNNKRIIEQMERWDAEAHAIYELITYGEVQPATRERWEKLS